MVHGVIQENLKVVEEDDDDDGHETMAEEEGREGKKTGLRIFSKS